ncbi:MAG: thiamine pyrophosphate-dependent dehydrogenase E1 component subunit alpha [Myxococcota bacterium]
MTATAFPVHPALPSPKVPPLGRDVPAEAHPDADAARALFGRLLLTRRLDERAVALYREGAIIGGCYTGIGNEATSVGMALPMASDDVLVPTQRDLGAHLVRGHSPLEVLRQYMKRDTAQTRGRDSGLHLGRDGGNIVGMVSHLGHMLGVATGVALAERQMGRTTAVVTTIGDGATSLGDFHEALNFAAVQRLPVVFVIVNNQYAYSTPPSLQYAVTRLADRAAGYGMPGYQVDGTDVLMVAEQTKKAIERGRAGAGPTLLECVTMRMRGHSEHDDFKYVPSALIDAWRAWDPIDRMKTYLSERYGDEPARFDAIDEAIKEEIDAAEAQARREPTPDPESAKDGVYRRWEDEWTVPAGRLGAWDR